MDELDLNKLCGDHNPAACLLAGHPLPIDMTTQMKTSIKEIEPNISPWLTDILVNYHMYGIPVTRTFGFMLNIHSGYGRLRVERLLAGSFVYDCLWDKHVEGLFLLAINRIKLRS